MTIQARSHAFQAISSESFSVRRDALTGSYVSVSGAAPALNSRARRLQANAELLASEMPTAKSQGLQNDFVADPLTSLKSRNKVADLPVHSEKISVFSPLSLDTVSRLIDEYISRFEQLVPRADISELRIDEICSAGKLESYISGFSSPTDLTETVNHQAQRWAQRTAGDLLADVLVSELVAQERVLINSDHWVAYIPYASLAPCEVMILPKANSRNLVATTDAAKEDLKFVYRQLTAMLLQISGTQASFSALWSMAPIPHCRSVSRMRVHMRLNIPSLEGLSPEEVAKTLHRYL